RSAAGRPEQAKRCRRLRLQWRLGLFYTTDSRYRERHGVRVGMRTAAAERVLHQRLHEACEANIYLDGPQASLTVVFKGKAMVSRRNGTVSGGHVYALVHHGNHHDPGVFECTVEPGGQSLPASET